MKATYFAAAAAVALAGMSGTAHAAFFGQAGNGDIYSIDQSSGVATQVSGPEGISSSSTNALGVDGSDFFRTQGDGGNDLFKNNTSFLTGVGTSFGATVFGGTYYAVDDSNNRLFSVDLSSSSPSKNFATNDEFKDGSLGDIVYDGKDLLVSQEGVGIVKVTTDGTVLDTFTNSDTSGSNPDARFPGLAFVGSELYGLNTDLTSFVQITLGSGSFSTGSPITITGAPDGVEFFDAATVPLPAAAWLMIGGLGAVGAYARRARKAAPTA